MTLLNEQGTAQLASEGPTRLYRVYFHLIPP